MVRSFLAYMELTRNLNKGGGPLMGGSVEFSHLNYAVGSGVIPKLPATGRRPETERVILVADEKLQMWKLHPESDCHPSWPTLYLTLFSLH